MKLFYGIENYLIKNALDQAKNSLDSGEDFLIFDEQDMLESILIAINNFDLFQNQKNIIIKNHPLLSKEKESQAFLDATENQLRKINIIFVWENAFLPKTKVIAFIKKHGKIEEFKNLTSKQINLFIKNLVSQNKGTITSRAILLLTAKLPNNLAIISNEINKMLQQNLNIDEKMIDQTIGHYLIDDYFALSNAIIDHDIYQIIHAYQEKIENNILPTMIIQQIASIFILAKNVYHLNQNNFSSKQIAAQLKIHPFRIQKTLQMILKTPIKKIDQLLVTLATLDQNIKSGLVNDKIGLDTYILKLVR